MMEVFFHVTLGLMGFGVLIGLVYFSLWAVLHKMLPPVLDPLLFREPWFQKSELVNYQFFPLSLIRSLNYSYLLAWPDMAKRRRFKGLDRKLPVRAGVIVLCRIHISAAFSGTLVAIFYFSIALYALFFL